MQPGTFTTGTTGRAEPITVETVRAAMQRIRDAQPAPCTAHVVAPQFDAGITRCAQCFAVIEVVRDEAGNRYAVPPMLLFSQGMPTL